MKYYLKQCVTPIVYQLFSSVIALGILFIGAEMVVLRVILLVLNLAMYVSIMGAVFFKEGQEAFKVRIANDLERMEIIRTGDALPLKLHEEYKWWKGFALALITCIPLFFLLLLHVILVLSVGTNASGAGVIAGALYMFVFGFVRSLTGISVPGESVIAVADPWRCLWALLAVPIIVLSIGIPYYFGAKKIELRQEKINETQRKIYGGKD